MSRIRNKDYNTVHHLTSRIAHRVHLLNDDERNDFMVMVKKVSEFAGVKLIGWCVMNNHFHLYVYLPAPPLLTDDEVLERFRMFRGCDTEVSADGVRSGDVGRDPRANYDDERAEAKAKKVAAIRRRMYSIAEYMRMIKQWFSEDYNQRNGHKGTMWSATYHDNAMYLPEDVSDYTDLRDILAYIHLNPIRAAITDRFDGYEWSSYTAYLRGDPTAVEAMRFAYRGFDDDAEIIAVHEERMSRLLEDCRLELARSIARKKANGFQMPDDPLVDEVMVAQETVHIAEVQKESERLNAERMLADGRQRKKELVCEQIVCEMSLHPEFSANEISEVIGVPQRTVYRYIADMRKSGRLPNVV